MAKTYISKEKFQVIWGKITTLFVAKEAGKGLSSNDYDAAAVAEVAKVANKVDKVEGKGLSSNDYDAAAVAEVAKIADKVDKVAGKGLSTNDYDNDAVAEVAKIAGKADSATSLSGYGITDAYTKDEIDTTVNGLKADMASVYKVKGTVAFDALPTEGMVEGDVYNVSNSFTVVEGFIAFDAEAETQKSYPAGTNVVYTTAGWDCLAGTYDFSGFMQKTDIVDITEEEINTICVLP